MMYPAPKKTNSKFAPENRPGPKSHLRVFLCYVKLLLGKDLFF